MLELQADLSSYDSRLSVGVRGNQMALSRPGSFGKVDQYNRNAFATNGDAE